MALECCKTLKDLLEKYDNKYDEIVEHDLFLFATTINESSRQCKCLLKNPALILPVETLLKKFYPFCTSYMENIANVNQWTHEHTLTSEVLFQALSKTFQLHYPIYQAYENVKNNFEITDQQRQAVEKFCDLSENTNASDLLFENIADFCEKKGVEKVTNCFRVENNQMPLNVAGVLISIVGQIRVWLNDDSIIKLIKPLSTPVSNYLCNIHEDDFRLMSARTTAEVMLSTVKVQDTENLSCDLDILNIAFKFFMSTTLAVRMAGLNLITNQIHHLIKLGQNQVYGDINNLCSQLSSWLNEKEIIQHLFGPNYHVELIKQSLFLLNFLAQERKLQTKHLDCIWSAAQLKHISRHVMDLLITLAKTMDLTTVQYLLDEIAKLPITSHTKQTLLLSSLLTRNIWSAGLNGCSPENKVQHPIPLKKSPFIPKPIALKQIHVSPIQSPSLSSDASTDEEVADIHAQQFMSSNQMEQIHDLDLKMSDSQLRALLPISPTPLEACLVTTSQESDLNTEIDDGASSMNTNCSSASDRDQDVMEDLDEEPTANTATPNLTPSPATLALPPPVVTISSPQQQQTMQQSSELLPVEFNVDTLCEPGKTLLWDLIQEHHMESLSEGIIDEAQKLLWQLICYTGDKNVRKVFVKGCLDNIKLNRSVTLSLKILPKILSGFPHSNNTKLFWWAVKDLKLMGCFFDNLKYYTSSWKGVDQGGESGGQERIESVGDREHEIQARLDFLTAMYSNDITPDHFRLTTEQVDCLWFCLVTQIPDSYNFLILSWLLKQTNSEELHALGLDSFKHIFVKKLPELNAEKMTLTGLNLFQKLFGLTRLSNASPFEQEAETEECLQGTEQLWNIALKAERIQVAKETINILNHLYLAVGERSVRKEEEFIKKCTSVLLEAVKNLEKNYLLSLRIIQQMLKILRNHLESYSKRFAFHLETWRLEGEEVRSHQCMRKPNNKEQVLKVLCQPMGMTEKVTFRMITSDLLAVFRARITYWCVHTAKKDEAINKDSLANLKPPFRLISLGHELTPDLDMKTMGELGVRDQQLVYISVANIRKDRIQNPSQQPASLLPAPNFHSVPMIQLLKEDNFVQLFDLTEVLYCYSKHDKYNRDLWSVVVEEKIIDDPCYSGNDSQQSSDNMFDDPQELVKPMSAEMLLYNAWDLILLLPTNVTIKNKIINGEFENPEKWNQLLNLEKKFKLLYILQILDSMTLPLLQSIVSSPAPKSHGGDSSGDSDSSLSDVDKDNIPRDICSLAWIRRLFQSGFVSHMLSLLLSSELDPTKSLDEWSLNGLAYIIKILTRIGLVDITYDGSPRTSSSSSTVTSQPQQQQVVIPGQKRHVFRARYRSTEIENIVVIHGLNQLLMDTLDLLQEDVLITRFITILTHVSENAGETSHIGSQDVRASVVYHTLSFLVCWMTTRPHLRECLINHKLFSSLLIQIVFFSPQKSVRTEASHGIYKLCVSSGQKVLNKVLNQLLEKLQELVSLRNELRLQTVQKLQQAEKLQLPTVTSSLSNYKDYFWLLCRLINKYKEAAHIEGVISIRTAILQVASFIQEDYDDNTSSSENGVGGHMLVDHCLVGLLQTCTVLLQHDLEFKNSSQGYELMHNIFHKCLFNLPNTYRESGETRPRCETKSSRQAAFELLLQLVSHSKEAYLELQKLLLEHHSKNKNTNMHSLYGWNYWPLEQERSSIGYVGLINLGATCYMASTVQQLFMTPEARTAILETAAANDMKHSAILKEVQKMFAYLQASIRKAYNPKSFCKTYTMDKQPINTGEQKDMTEFFTDFVSKLEDMSPNLKKMTRGLFCGVITNNVLSLDCTHVSKMEEEFYFVRCTVADMKNLYESLDEVTVKDVLEGDNKYTCSQCDAKVRAEKRACFKSLPKVLCFNTMRYTFNMVTMMKEKVNTHFSFPMKLNMAAYTEEYLLKRKGEGDPDEIPGFWYNLVGVVVHTGTAEGGHYYSFIRDRTTKENSWYLFNDAEVKNFDPVQIAAECFGGEMTTKTFDAMTEKYMDFSFEKTHSAYMLFYEHCDIDNSARLRKQVPIPSELQEQIWEDNYQFLQDKLVFDPSYFNFLWQFCYNMPRTIKGDVLFHTVKLATSFLLETLVHSREKLHMKGWVELLVHGFDRSRPACEWFLDNMAEDDWWLQQIMIRCPLQHIRQMFCQLCLMAIKNLRQAYVQHYTQQCEDDCWSDEEHEIGSCSPITRFIKSLLSLLKDNLRSYCKNLSELFQFMYQFLSLGHEECGFLLRLNGISILVQFYNSLKAGEVHEAACDEDDDIELDDDEIITMFSDEKFYPTSLDKMIGSIALLLEEARDGPELHLSEADMKCFSADKDFPFIYQITADVINLHQTANIIFHLSCYNELFAGQIVQMLLQTAQRLPVEQSQPFFKLLSLLTDVGENGMPGLPSFIGLILPRLGEAIECNPAVTLEWLSTQVIRNKQAHQWVKEHMDKWVERYLVADNSPRVRAAASFLLVSLIPNNHFQQAFRGRVLSAPTKELKMSNEAKNTLRDIYKFLLEMLPLLKKYCDKQHGGTTKLVNFFTLINYLCLSNEEKEMFTPYSSELWNIYHPSMSEPDIAVHFNKQALLMFWYHVCEGCDQNIKCITDTEEVASNIAYNYILSNDDQEVISFNNATLPLYYGLLRQACAYSTQFCKTLSTHPNMMWAFEHLIPRANHYAQAVDELIQLIRLFSGTGYTNPEDMAAAVHFRSKSIELFCNCMDASHTWTTLVNILKQLIESEEDCVHVAYSNGLNALGEAFSTLHIMYHEATACNVTADIIEVANLLQTIVECCFNQAQKTTKALKALQSWTERTDIMLKALSLLNSYVPVDIHKACIDLLGILLQAYPEDCIEVCAPLIHQSHLNIRLKQNPAPAGPYFPRLGSQQKASSHRKLSRSGCGELNMTLHPRVVDTFRNEEKNFVPQLRDYFEPYHIFVDKVCRYGLNLDPVPSIITDMSCLLAVEALPLKFHMFQKLWQEVWQKSNENPKYKSCIQALLITESFIEYWDTLFTDERELLDDVVFYSFVCFFLPKVHNKILLEQKQHVADTIISSLAVDTKNLEMLDTLEFEQICPRIHGDMRALALLISVAQHEVKIPEMVEGYVDVVVSRYSLYKKDEERKRVKQELDQKRQKLELEQQKHKEELEERKRTQNSSQQQEEKEQAQSSTSNQEVPEHQKTVQPTTVTTPDSVKEPPMKRKKKTTNEPTNKNTNKEKTQTMLKPTVADVDDAQPGPSSMSANDSRCDVSSITSDGSDVDESSGVSSDEFSSGSSDSDHNDPQDNDNKSKEQYSSVKPAVTAQVRKTCESLKGLLARRRRRELEEKLKIEEEQKDAEEHNVKSETKNEKDEDFEAEEKEVERDEKEKEEQMTS